jgi:ribose/xylose/arabinose/galactoside ABC-type transport system permease subunit
LRAVALLAVLVGILFWATGSVSFIQAMDNARQAAPLGVIALGQALILMMGRLDLSVGATAGLANVVLATTFAGQMDNMLPALAITFGCGTLVGLTNGFLVVVLRIGLPALAASWCVHHSGGTGGSLHRASGPSPKAGSAACCVRDHLLAVSVAGLVLVHTLLGRKVLFRAPISRRPAAAFRPAASILSFVLASILATLGGVLLSAITGMASIGIADAYTVDSIAAAVIGGALFIGGVFLPAGVLAGGLILFFLQSLLYVLSLPAAARFILQGVIIIVALALANLQRRR